MLEFAGHSTSALVVFFVVFGWCLEKRELIAVIAVLLFLMYFTSVSFMTSNIFSLIEQHLSSASVLLSVADLVRCFLAVIMIAELDRMGKIIGVGGFHTLLA
ncbi:uncharacterized protein PRCAT00002769001 [Priceomyces carsonii]|uniref:uncharacterized protein n=1 Tax=Priceomyces carsonii TaxID=28549 RepID=UPI002ED7F77F|nr:unnamed protein product [Priceomyces carsonii]